MKFSKAQIQAKYHKIPVIRFEDQQLTSFSGLLIFQLLFKRIDLKQRLKKCFAHLKVSPIFGRHLIVLLIIVHLLIGFRRLREVDYYRDDPIVLRLMGLRKLPDVSTISRMARFSPLRLMQKVQPSASTKKRKVPAVTILCFAPWRKQDSFSISTIAPEMSMTPMALVNSC